MTVAPSTTAGFNVTATNSPNYQWYLNGGAISGATSARLVLTGATAAKAGTYTCTVTNGAGSASSTPATLAFMATANPGRLGNLSVLAEAGNGAQPLTVGFEVGGAATSGTQVLLLRGDGPLLAAAPFSLAANAGWRGDPQIATAASSVYAFAWGNPGSYDSALLITLPPGNYTAQVSSVSGAAGTTLVEVYDIP